MSQRPNLYTLVTWQTRMKGNGHYSPNNHVFTLVCIDQMDMIKATIFISINGYIYGEHK